MKRWWLWLSLILVALGGAALLSLSSAPELEPKVITGQPTVTMTPPPPVAVPAPEAGNPPTEPRKLASPRSRPPQAEAGPIRPLPVIPPPRAYAPRELERTWPDANRNRAFEELSRASLAFSVDPAFNVADAGHAKVVIDPTKEVDALKDELRAESKSGAIIGGASVGVTKVVSANVVAPGLTVTAITPSEQLVLPTEPTTWLWELRGPPGKYEVKITLVASIIVDGRPTNRLLRVFEQTVTVEVTPAQKAKGFVEKYWQWAFSTLLLPLGLWLWKRRKANQ